MAAPANIAEMDRRFVKQFGGPDNEQILVLPLVLKEKVAALSICGWRIKRIAGRCVFRSTGHERQYMAGSCFAAQASSGTARGRERTVPAGAPVQTVTSFPTHLPGMLRSM